MTSERKPRPSFRLVQCPVIYKVFAHLDFEGLADRFGPAEIAADHNRNRRADDPGGKLGILPIFANGVEVGESRVCHMIPEQGAIAFHGLVYGDRLANRAVLVEPLRVVPLVALRADASAHGYRPSKLAHVDPSEFQWLEIKGFELLHAGRSRGRIAARPEGRRR